MDAFSVALLFAAAGIAVWLWHIAQGTRALVEDARRNRSAGAGITAGDTGGQGYGIDGGSTGHADGGACGMDGGGGGHC